MIFDEEERETVQGWWNKYLRISASFPLSASHIDELEVDTEILHIQHPDHLLQAVVLLPLLLGDPLANGDHLPWRGNRESLFSFHET